MKSDLDKPANKRDLDEAVGQIVGAISKTLEGYASKKDLKGFSTKEDIAKLATKEDVKHLEKKLSDKIDALGGDVTDLRRRVIDLETVTSTN